MDVRAGFSALPAQARPAFRVGGTLVEPATRELTGPHGTVSIEPRVLQVLLALVDAGGSVVTRDMLMDRCWNGQFVGDDALNRAIAQIRKTAREIDPGGFGVDTISKTGYRLTGDVVAAGKPLVAEAAAVIVPAVSATTPLSRRWLIGGGIAGLAAADGIAGWRLLPSPQQKRAGLLVERGAQALREGLPESDAQGLGFLNEAVALDPGDAAAWGKLALAWRNTAEYAEPSNTAAAVTNTQTAARRALALDARQGDALAALATLAPIYGDWLAAEQRLKNVLAVAPGNLSARDALGILQMSTGQVSARLADARLLVQREPLSPVYTMHLIYGLWSNGHAAEAERVAGRAFVLWPEHPAIWFARLWTLAFTGRAATALGLVEEAQRRQAAPSRVLGLLALSMRALDSRAPADVAATAAGQLAAARTGESAAINAVQILSALGATDAAFDVANGYFLNRGPVTMALLHPPGAPSLNDQRRPKTMLLFVPPSAGLRADARFLPLCDAMGLTDYWWRSGHRPDFIGNAPMPRPAALA